MQYKGYDVPGDLLLIMKVFALVMHYRRAIHKEPLPDLIEEIKGGGGGSLRLITAPDQARLEKAARAADFLLLRVMGTAKPCLPRSLALLHWCREQGIRAEIAIGVKKSEDLLEGHSWLLLEGQPYREDPEHLAEYTIMMEGSNQ